MLELEKLAADILVCKKCILSKSRTNAVPGEGPPHASIMLIGEGPGFHEDKQGRPFVGTSGQFLEELLAGIGFKRQDVFITNVVKCRPPGNRDPMPDEIEACKFYLDRQIELINPRVIVTLGRYSMARWFPNAKISAIHGQARKFEGRLVVPMFHPAAALHQPSLRKDVEADFHKLPDILKQFDQLDDAEPPGPEAEQLSLF